MPHPLYPDAPSREMSAAAERQAALDFQIAAFLKSGGQIQAFDNLQRPVEMTYTSFAINPKKAQAVPPGAASRKKPRKPAKPTSIGRVTPADEQLAVKIIVEAALGGTPAEIAHALHIPIDRCVAIAEQCHVQFHR